MAGGGNISCVAFSKAMSFGQRFVPDSAVYSIMNWGIRYDVMDEEPRS